MLKPDNTREEMGAMLEPDAWQEVMSKVTGQVVIVKDMESDNPEFRSGAGARELPCRQQRN